MTDNTEIDNENISNVDINKVDKQEKFEDNSLILNFICKKSLGIFYFFSFFLFCSFSTLVPITIIYEKDINYKFALNQLIKYISISLIQYIMALFVIHKNVKVNYTRKVIHISYFILPQILDIVLFKYDKDIFTELWNIWIILTLLILLSEHVRKIIPFVDTMFKAVDRPEDRPYTLIWFSSQTVVSILVLIPFSLYFNHIDKVKYTFIPILINGLADGLAEPVGIRFGKHKYETKACLSNKKYQRSYEGSLCVFLVSTIIIGAYYKYMTLYHYLFNILTIPIITTITEAYAPHTWDCPLIFLVVSGFLCISTFIS